MTAAGLTKPDLVAPGVNIQAPDVYGSFLPVTGTSFATPIVSGAAALLMEWGIVQGNDPFLYGENQGISQKRCQTLKGREGISQRPGGVWQTVRGRQPATDRNIRMNGSSYALETVPEPEGRKTDEITSRIPLFVTIV